MYAFKQEHPGHQNRAPKSVPVTPEPGRAIVLGGMAKNLESITFGHFSAPRIGPDQGMFVKNSKVLIWGQIWGVVGRLLKLPPGQF